MTNDVKNVDDILVPREQAMLNKEPIPAQAVDVSNETSKKEGEIISQTSENQKESTQESNEYGDLSSPSQETTDKSQEPELVKEVKKDSPIDEYGNPTEKPKMYSEDEVQRMIRDRLSRDRHSEQPTPQQIQQEAKDFKADPNSEESWEQQLEQFVEKTIDKRQQKLSEKQWREQESARQAEFESKFTTSMNKYSDFHQVIKGKPITDTMMLAARDLKDPAAFIYAAAKLQPQELERISRISDPYSQAAEVGRLHEKMVKMRNTTSQTGKPLEPPKGDMPIKQANDFGSLESRIDQHARQKRAR